MEEHILLVDDDPRTCKVLDACLTDWDWRVWKAENAARASDPFTRLGPALLREVQINNIPAHENTEPVMNP